MCPMIAPPSLSSSSSSSSSPLSSTRQGVWTPEEHDRFLRGLQAHPRGPWQRIAEVVVTRSSRQVQTHAQKFFQKVHRHQRGLRRTTRPPKDVVEHRVDAAVLRLLAGVDEHELFGTTKATAKTTPATQGPEPKPLRIRKLVMRRPRRKPQLSSHRDLTRHATTSSTLSIGSNSNSSNSDSSCRSNNRHKIPSLSCKTTSEELDRGLDRLRLSRLPSIEEALDFFINVLDGPVAPPASSSATITPRSRTRNQPEHHHPRAASNAPTDAGEPPVSSGFSGASWKHMITA